MNFSFSLDQAKYPVYSNNYIRLNTYLNEMFFFVGKSDCERRKKNTWGILHNVLCGWSFAFQNGCRTITNNHIQRFQLSYKACLVVSQPEIVLTLGKCLMKGRFTWIEQFFLWFMRFFSIFHDILHILLIASTKEIKVSFWMETQNICV